MLCGAGAPALTVPIHVMPGAVDPVEPWPEDPVWVGLGDGVGDTDGVGVTVGVGVSDGVAVCACTARGNKVMATRRAADATKRQTISLTPVREDVSHQSYAHPAPLGNRARASLRTRSEGQRGGVDQRDRLSR
jgi:hypothetical protein